MKHRIWLAGATLAAALLGSAAQAQTTLTMWYHGAGNEVEAKILDQIVADFNGSQADWKVEVQSFPQAAYNRQRCSRCTGGQSARYSGCGRACHAELGMVGLHAAFAD
jgi:ABC-type glycerol-3-phosphate transport system substrate-binding protein